MDLIKLDKVSKIYRNGDNVSIGMRNVSLKFNIGEFIAITGESGSGKSTLLNVVSGLDGYEEGEMYLFDEPTSHYTVSNWENYRGAHVGFIFQSYNLIDSYTVLQNVMIALKIEGYDPKLRKSRALELIEKVGLTSHKHHKAAKLSGGEKQRVAIARALAKNSPIIAADEPTGNLDSNSGKAILELLHEISKEKLVLIVTHNYEEVKKYATRKIRMHDGEVIEDKEIKKHSAKEINRLENPKPMKVKDIIGFSKNNLLAMPRKTFFMLLMQFLVVSVFVIVFTLLVMLVSEVGLGRSEKFKNAPETRMIIEKRSGEKMNQGDIDYLSSLYGVRKVYENAYNFFNSGNIQDTINYNYFDSTDVSSSLSKWMVKGNLATKFDEVVVPMDFKDTYEIGSTIEIVNSFSGYYFMSSNYDMEHINYFESYKIGDFKVVGYDKTGNNTLYFSDAFIKEYDKGIDLSQYSKYYNSINNNIYVEYEGENYYVSQSFVLEKGVLSFIGDNEEIEEKTVTLTFACIDYKYEKHEFEKEYRIKVPKNGEISMVLMAYEDYRIVLEDFLNDVISTFSDDDSLLVLSVYGYKDGNRVLNKIDKTKYRVYYPANISDPMSVFFKFLYGLLSGVGLIILGIVLFSIVRLVSRNILFSREKDFAIFRSIGMDKKTLSKNMVIEQIIISIVAFALALVLLFVLGNTVGEFAKALRYMDIFSYLILFIFIMGLTIRLGLKFNKKIFKQSVIETLSESKGDKND